MTVKDAMNKINAAEGCYRFLYELAGKEQDENIKDYLAESADLLDEYVDVLEQMKVQRT